MDGGLALGQRLRQHMHAQWVHLSVLFSAPNMMSPRDGKLWPLLIMASIPPSPLLAQLRMSQPIDLLPPWVT